MDLSIENLQKLKHEIQSDIFNSKITATDNENTSSEMVKLVDDINQYNSYINDMIKKLLEDEDRLRDLEHEEREMTEENGHLKKRLEQLESNQNEDNQSNLQVYEAAEKKIDDLKCENFRLKNSISDTKVKSDKLLKCDQLYQNMSIENSFKYDDESCDMKQYREFKVYEALMGIKIDSNNHGIDFNSYMISYLNLKEDCIDELNNQNGHSKALKRRKLTKSNQILKANLNDSKFIIQNYIQLICLSLMRADIEDAMNHYAIDWIDGTKKLTILINSSSKIAQIQLPNYYPFTGTSNIKLNSLTGFEEEKIKHFRIEDNLASLSAWVTSFIDLYNAQLI